MSKTIYMPEYRNLIAALRKARQQRGLKQDEVARRVGKSRSWYGRVEQVQILLDPVELVLVARACGISAARLVAKLEKDCPLVYNNGEKVK